VDPTTVGGLKFHLKRGAGSYGISITPTGPGGKELLPEADIPSNLISTFAESSNGTILLQGLKPGQYKITFSKTVKEGDTYTGVNAGEATVSVVAGKTPAFTL
jgi:hypothetical protein